jgi:hypothetical protein
MLDNLTKLISATGLLLIGLSLVATVAVSFIGLPQVTRFLDLKARHDCASDYRLEFRDQATNTTITQPVEDLYQKCLAEKGV